jgi:hypothetical protein
MPVYEVPPVYITGKNASLEQQNSMTLPGKQHCRYRTRTAGANHNRVVHVASDPLQNCNGKMLTEDRRSGL